MKRFVAALSVCLLLFAAAVGVLAQEKPQQKKKKTTKSYEYCVEYLNEVKEHLTTSYIHAEKVNAGNLMRAAALGMAEVLSAPEFRSVDAEGRDAIAARLREGTFETIEAIFAALKEVVEAHKIKKLDFVKIADAAAMGMLKEVGDPFSHIFTQEELMKLMQIMFGQARDESLGLSVAPEDGKLTVAYVMFGYPAYVAGLEIGDVIVAINGKPAADMDFKAANEALQAKAGTTTTLTIKREGLLKDYTFELNQFKDRPKDVIHAMLPGQIGYLRMTIFDLSLAGSVRSALKALEEDKMCGLILDLRHNPGGALPAATSVADEFIGDKKLITYTETKYKPKMPFEFLQDMLGQQPTEFRATKKSRFEKLPVVLLIDKASASASELLSGAFQDTGRAILIGETTYGKGVGQTAIPLWKSGGSGGMFGLPSRFLYLTVMKYYLPTGRSIDHIGVSPDIEVPAPKLKGEKFDRVWQLKRSGKLEEYVNSNYEANKQLFHELAMYDAFDSSRYPGFESFCKGLKTKLGPDEVREELRQAIRRKIENESGKRFPYDCQSDVQLQAALLEMQDTLGK
ncbi:MAG: S41 family peptidase [Planctomycetota bacterium]|nr:S41 family peptidase [Planctomycetota bacterium]